MRQAALIHIADDDKDWIATLEGPIVVGVGSDDGTLFRIISYPSRAPSP